MDLRELTGAKRPSIVVLRDPRVGEHTHEPRAQLRSLPLLSTFGFDRVLHTAVWNNDFKPVDYTPLNPESIDIEQVEFPLVHVVSQEALLETTDKNEPERRGEQHLMRELLRKRTENDTYVIVSDTDAPDTPAYAERPVTDDFKPVTKVDYEGFINRYVQTTLDSYIPLNETRNYWYHLISDHNQQYGAPADSLPRLFEYEKAPPNSPAWWPLYYFVEHDLDRILEKYTERIRETLRSWTERGDVQKVANNMDSMLVQCGFRADKLDRQRERNAEKYDIDIEDIQSYDNA